MSRSGRYQRLYAMLLDAMPSSALLFDHELRVISANRNFLEKGERSMANTLGQRIGEVFPEAILEHTDLADRLSQAFTGQQEAPPRSFTYRAPGVPLRCYYSKIVPLSRADGSVEAVLLLLDDVTGQMQLTEEIRRIEQHLACVVECASDIVLSTDARGRLVTWNRAAERLSGYSASEVRERLFVDLCAPEHREEARHGVIQTAAGGRPGSGCWSLLVKDGRTVPITWTLSSLDGKNDEVRGIVAVGRDLNEQRKLEFALAQSQKLAALGVMADGLAHEIRNPLAIGSSYTQMMLEDDSDPARRRQRLRHVFNAIGRAAAIIENLLRYTRSPSPSQTFGPIDLTGVLNNVLGLLEHSARSQLIRLLTRMPQQPVWVIGDATLLQQVFMNLCLRAIGAMHDGGVLSVEMTQDVMQAAITVGDTGPAIDPADLSSVFDPFHSAARHGTGGLELCLCYSIVKQHLGSIEAASALAHGNTFTVRLPTL